MTNPGTYDDLKEDIQGIHSGDVYNITRDYEFDSKGQTIILQNRIIEISQNNIVINGNGFKIDAGGSQNFAIFKVLGNNVTINNLTFANSEPGSIPGPTIHDNYRYIKINSPICWQGDNGVMKDCSFYNDCSVNGGAMTWMGNNGTIDNCRFINNTARGAGGALYIGGGDNTISNCTFINSSSQLSGESIYTDRNHKRIRLHNDTFINGYSIVDGAVFNIDVNYLFYSCKVPVWGNISASESYKLDVIPLIYKSIMMGGVNNISDNFNYFAQYLNKTGDFVLNIAAYEEISEPGYHFGLDYLKSMCFTNITDFNQVFDSVLHGNYTFSLTQNLIGYVHNAYDYLKYSGVESCGYWFSTDKDIKDFINNLKVVFTDKIDVSSSITWNPKKMGFTSVIIMGNGSTIKGNAKNDRDEKKWVELDDKFTFMAYDLTVKNFNTAVQCFAGACYFNNIRFDNNRMNYYVERDWGAAILSTSTVVCENCIFTNNYAKNGGAIFNQGFLSLSNTTFKGNTAYSERGDNVCVGDGGLVQVDGKNITSDTKDIYFTESISTTDKTFIGIVVGVGAFASGFLTSVFTCNPAIGIVVGASFGAAFGLFAGAEIIDGSFDVNFDRLGCCALFVSIGIITGVTGGIVGYYASAAYGSTISQSMGEETVEETVRDSYRASHLTDISQ